MESPDIRDDVSLFVVHLTRRHEDASPRQNLVSILNQRTIEARTAHCLFSPLFTRLQFTDVLKKKFKTVCFTETPLNQISRLCSPLPKRKIKLQPYGLVFYKNAVLEKGGSPAMYVNTHGTQIRDYLLQQFRQHFNGIRSLKRFAKDQRQYHEQIIQYYSLINIIASHHDYTWEREWRFSGHFTFKYIDIVAIIARDPGGFTEYCKEHISGPRSRTLRKVPVISPNWNYEQIVDAMSCQIWDSMS
jgi:hypothetical protein